MNKNELNNKAKDIFKSNPKEDMLYCIEDGNFWYAANKVSADVYSRKLGLELITIYKKDLKEDKEVKPKANAKRVSKPKTTKTKSKK